MSTSGVSASVHAQASSQTSAASSAAAQASLNRLLAKYKTEISSQPASQNLASLARQITAAAKALGQHVTLPKASAAPATAAVSKPEPQSAAGTSVDMKA